MRVLTILITMILMGCNDESSSLSEDGCNLPAVIGSRGTCVNLDEYGNEIYLTANGECEDYDFYGAWSRVGEPLTMYINTECTIYFEEYDGAHSIYPLDSQTDLENGIVMMGFTDDLPQHDDDMNSFARGYQECDYQVTDDRLYIECTFRPQWVFERVE